MAVRNQYITFVLGNGLGDWRAGLSGVPCSACRDAMGCGIVQLVTNDRTPGYAKKAKARYDSEGILSAGF